MGSDNFTEKAGLKYKRAYFVDWRAADRLKKQVLPRADFLLDTNGPTLPKLISGTDRRAALAATVHRPFRMVPFFDPGPWGGQWLREVCDLPNGPANYARALTLCLPIPASYWERPCPGASAPSFPSASIFSIAAADGSSYEPDWAAVAGQ